METEYLEQIATLKAQKAVLERKIIENEVWKELYNDLSKRAQGLLDQLAARNQALEARNKILENPGGIHYESLSWLGKVVFVLRKIKRPLRSRDIDQELKVMDGLNQLLNTRSDTHLSVVLSNAVREGQLHLQKVKGSRGAYYALPAWLDEEGKLKEKMRRELW